MKTIKKNLVPSILAVLFIAVGLTNIITIMLIFSITAIGAIGTTIRAEPKFLSTSEQAF
jgi:hypothetical protein